MKVVHEIEINVRPEIVFDFLVETDNFPIVDRALVSFTPHARMRPGMTGTFVHRRAGFTARTTWEVMEFEPSRRVRVAVRGMGYAMDELATLDAAGSGTLVRFVDTVRPTSLPGRLMVALSSGIMRRDLETRAARLKTALESDASGLTAPGLRSS